MAAGKRFQKKKEDFVCINCGKAISGGGYTDHCPHCLFSLHVDNNPGDRKAECRGIMEPTHADYKAGEFTITYRCRRCGATKKVMAAHDDNRDLLVSLVNA